MFKHNCFFYNNLIPIYTTSTIVVRERKLRRALWVWGLVQEEQHQQEGGY